MKNVKILIVRLIGGEKLARSINCFLGTVFFVILFWQLGQHRTTSLQYQDQQGTKHTLTLPIKDRKRLANLMQKLFAEDNFAYTLLGSKPISWATYQNPLPLINWTTFYDAFSKRNRTLRAGWKTWEKYQHLFPSLLLWAESPQCHPGYVSILIVNADRLNEVVKKNKQDFQEVLGREIVDGYQLLSEAKDQSLINGVLEGHQALIGIVLGYGRDNAWQFSDGCKIRKPIGWVWEDESNYFANSVESDILAEYYLSHYSCPSFSGDPNSAESIGLKTEYMLTKRKVLEYYKGKDFLEATLSLLAGYHPD